MRDQYEALAMNKPMWFHAVMTTIVLLGVVAIVVLV